MRFTASLLDFEGIFARQAIKKLDGIIVINSHLINYYNKMNKNILVAPDGVDLDMFSINENKSILRTKLNIEKDKKIVLYAGHLYKWKGIYTLLDAIEFLPDSFSVYILGGTDKDIKSVKDYVKSANIKANILGRVTYKNVPLYLKAADILVLPNSDKSKYSKLYTSPLKLFEYMAAGNTIVSTDVPSSMEILNEKNAILVEPENPRALASGIKKAAMKNSDKLAKQALQDVKQYSWQERTIKILDFFSH